MIDNTQVLLLPWVKADMPTVYVRFSLHDKIHHAVICKLYNKYWSYGIRINHIWSSSWIGHYGTMKDAKNAADTELVNNGYVFVSEKFMCMI